MAANIVAERVHDSSGSLCVEPPSVGKMDASVEEMQVTEGGPEHVKVEKVTETDGVQEVDGLVPDRTSDVLSANVEHGASENQKDQGLVVESKPDITIEKEAGKEKEEDFVVDANAAAIDGQKEGDSAMTIILDDTASLAPVASMPDASAGANPTTPIPDSITTPVPRPRTQSPHRSIQAQPIPTSNSEEVPSLLLRMGPPISDSGTPTTNVFPTIPPVSPSKPLLPKPAMDTWFPDDVVTAFERRNTTDSYIAPRSPSPGRSGGGYHLPSKRRLERSPLRARYEGDRERHRASSHTIEEPYRGRLGGSSWRDERLPNKRRRSEAADELMEHRYDHRAEPSREHHWPRERTDLPRADGGRMEYDNNRHRHRMRSPSVERSRDWASRRGVDGGHDQLGAGSRDEHRHGNGARAVDRRRDSRSRDRVASARTLHDDYSRKLAREDDKYSRKSDGLSRTREYVEAQRQPTRRSEQDHRNADPVDHPPRSAGRASLEWDRMSSKPYDGGQAKSGRSAHLSPARQNGREIAPINRTNGSAYSDPRVTHENRWDRNTNAAPQSPPSGGQNLGPGGSRTQPYLRPPALQTPGNYSNGSQSNSAPSRGWRQAVIIGPNAEPRAGLIRRGYDPPRTSPPSAAPHSSLHLQHPMPKDTLAPPLQDKEYILAKYAAQKQLVKSVWIDNPKAPVANFLTGGKGGANGLGPRGPAYRVTTGRLGGKTISRATLPIRGHSSIVGTGDDPIRVQAEKLACLSALFQLAEAGLIKCEEQPVEEPPIESVDIDDADSEEVTQLSTGETITLREARSFMDYYCKRFGFGQPHISYETVAMRAGPQKWEAIMEVGGKKIGLGAGTTKKMATRVCYLDVTSYLEKCDQELWREYLEHAKSQAI